MENLVETVLLLGLVVALGGWAFSALRAARRGTVQPPQCGACGRLVSRAAPRCRYCGADLPD